MLDPRNCYVGMVVKREESTNHPVVMRGAELVVVSIRKSPYSNVAWLTLEGVEGTWSSRFFSTSDNERLLGVVVDE